MIDITTIPRGWQHYGNTYSFEGGTINKIHNGPLFHWMPGHSFIYSTHWWRYLLFLQTLNWFTLAPQATSNWSSSVLFVSTATRTGVFPSYELGNKYMHVIPLWYSFFKCNQSPQVYIILVLLACLSLLKFLGIYGSPEWKLNIIPSRISSVSPSLTCFSAELPLRARFICTS